MGVQNTSRSQPLAFSLLLVELSARRHKLGCLFLSVLIFARALCREICFCAPFGALRLSARLIPNREPHPESRRAFGATSSYSESGIFSRLHYSIPRRRLSYRNIHGDSSRHHTRMCNVHVDASSCKATATSSTMHASAPAVWCFANMSERSGSSRRISS